MNKIIINNYTIQSTEQKKTEKNYKFEDTAAYKNIVEKGTKK